MAGTCRAGRRKRASAVIAGFARKLPGLLLSGLFLYTASSPVLCADPVSLEYEVKAAFLFNFTKFVQWPSSAFADANSAFEICIVGDDPFGKTLDDIVQGESVDGHRISIQRIQVGQQQRCHVLYSGKNLPPQTATEAGSAVLTVGDGTNFVHDGGIIGFILEDRRIRFDINLRAATNAGLKMSSRLLTVARYVER